MADQWESYLAGLSAEHYLALLAQSGWLADVPAAERARLEQTVPDAFADDPLYAWTALTMVELDSESIYDVGDGALSYQAHLRTLADASDGVFQPVQVHDKLVDDTIRISFALNGRSYTYDTPAESDYFDEGVIDTINQALADSGTPKRYWSLPTIDQVLRLVIVSQATFDSAVRLRVVPPPAYFGYRERDEPAELDHYLASYYAGAAPQ